MILLIGSLIFLTAPDKNAKTFSEVADSFFVDFPNSPKVTIEVKIVDNYLGYKKGWAGMCVYNRGKYYKEIFIERDVFKKNIWFIHQVIYHELGHCVLDLRHADKRNNLMARRKFDTNSINWGDELDNMKKDWATKKKGAK
jgi:hypothetical protein